MPDSEYNYPGYDDLADPNLQRKRPKVKSKKISSVGLNSSRGSRHQTPPIGQMPCLKQSNHMLERAKMIYEQKIGTLKSRMKKNESEQSKLKKRNSELMEMLATYRCIEKERDFYVEKEKKYLHRENLLKTGFGEWRDVFLELVSNLEDLSRYHDLRPNEINNYQRELEILRKIRDMDWADWNDKLRTMEQRLG